MGTGMRLLDSDICGDEPVTVRRSGVRVRLAVLAIAYTRVLGVFVVVAMSASARPG